MPRKTKDEREFEEALAIEVAKLKAAHEKANKPRYRDGHRIKESVRMFVRPSRPGALEFAVSFDLIVKLWQWRDYKKEKDVTLPNWAKRSMTAEFVTFRDKTLPGVSLRLEPLSSYRTRGVAVTQKKGYHSYTIAASAKKIGLNAEHLRTRKIDYLEWPEEKALLLIFEPQELLRNSVNSDPQIVRDIVAGNVDSYTDLD